MNTVVHELDNQKFPPLLDGCCSVSLIDKAFVGYEINEEDTIARKLYINTYNRDASWVEFGVEYLFGCISLTLTMFFIIMKPNGQCLYWPK